MKALGWGVALTGAAVMTYSFPFASYVALEVFLLGVAIVVTGLRMALRRHRA